MVAQLSRRVLWSPEGQNPVTAYGLNVRLCKLQQLMHTRTNQEDDAGNGEHLLVYHVPRSLHAKQTIVGRSLCC
ncbi:hypothetical protein IG631_07911 [Alternaria alternata]|nr:hypothetical protein IG631_07911 [Alternaria alternata]